MTLRVRFEGQNIGQKLEHGMIRQADRVGQAAAKTMLEVSKTILQRGRAQMKSAGKFGSARWQSGLTAPVVTGGNSLNVAVAHSEGRKFWIFEKGGVIKGSPLLWIPLSFAKEAKGVLARNFPGGLFRVDRKGGGAPLLLSIKDQKPKYFGKASVKIPRKFFIRDIAKQVSRQMRAIYNRHFASGR